MQQTAVGGLSHADCTTRSTDQRGTLFSSIKIFASFTTNHENSAAPFHSNTPFGSSTNTLSLQAHDILFSTSYPSVLKTQRSSFVHLCRTGQEWNIVKLFDIYPFNPLPPPFLFFHFLHRRDTYTSTKDILILVFTLNFQNRGGESTLHDLTAAHGRPR